MSQLLEIMGSEFEILKMELSDEQFANYLENGIPEYDDDNYDEFMEEFENSDGDSGFDCSDIQSIEVYVDGALQKGILSNDTINIGSTYKWRIGNNYLVRIQSGASTSLELELDGDFDKNKLQFTVYKNELPNGFISELSVTYDDGDFEYMGGSGFSYSEMFLVDKEGKVHNL